MLLDRIDIDAHGPLHHVELGPFAEHLNVIFGPPGSGKTAITRFVRDSLVERNYPQGMLSASTGRVIWADRNGLVHCRREQDGTVVGRRSVEFESRGETLRHLEGHGQSWFGDMRASTASSRAIQSLQLPESIVDGVITDTAITSVARVVSACVRAGLDSAKTYQGLPLHEDATFRARDAYSAWNTVADQVDQPDHDRHRKLRQQLADVEAELVRINGVTHPNAYSSHAYRDQESTWNDHLSRLHGQARRLRARQAELRRWLAEIDHEIGGSTDHTAPFESVRYRSNAGWADQTLRARLDDLDAQMIRWRRALSEVRGLRSAILSGNDHHLGSLPHSVADERMLERMRFDGFMHAVDRYDRASGRYEYYRESYKPLNLIDDIDYRIESATRQIDWLLRCYADRTPVQSDWYRPLSDSTDDGGSTPLDGTLRNLRQDLDQLRRCITLGIRHSNPTQTEKLSELQRSEHWLVTAIEQLNGHRESLLRAAADGQGSESARWARSGRYDSYVLLRDRRESERQLERVHAELERCLSEAAAVRRKMRSLPIINRHWSEDLLRDPMHASGFSYHAGIPRHKIDSLHRRRAQILEQLSGQHQPTGTPSPLADAASRWLIRLTGGRLRQISWPYRSFEHDGRSHHRASEQQTGVLIDGRDEQRCSAADRAVTVLAVRMAAGDLLARTGRHVPLVLETGRQGYDQTSDLDTPHRSAVEEHYPGQSAYGDNGDLSRRNSPFASALRDYTRAGRQIVLFTSDQSLTDQLTRVGARPFQLHSRPVVHAHRPLWKPHYQAEHYVGPHPHTYGHRDADDVLNQDQHVFDSYIGSVPYRHNPLRPTGDVNRDLDMAWHESNLADLGNPVVYDRPVDRDDQHIRYQRASDFSGSSEQTDWSRDGHPLRDGYYVANSFTTNDPVAEGIRVQPSEGDRAGQHTCCLHQPTKTIAEPASPFFLTVDSPIDQAPSIDAVAAARLRGLKVTHINHLMQRDSNRLADALGLATVDASTIRRWQSECRLVCRVPQLRGFDARVLVGCGVTTPAQLAAIHPVDLLQQVEAFLASDRGQQILLSGSSHELSRITSWIAAANSGDQENIVNFGSRQTSRRGLGERGGRNASGSVRAGASQRATSDSNDLGFDRDRYEYESGTEVNRRRRVLRSSRRKNRSTTDANASRRSTKRRGSSRRSGSPSKSAGRSRSSSHNSKATREFVSYNRDSRRYDRDRRRSDEAATVSDQELKFYLQRESLVADGPSIGNRMSERLGAVGIETVNDLLNADPETVAAELDHRRVDADTITQWQQQATLVCRVPMLRGHDAQLLVAAEVTTPEELAECDPQELFAIIDPIARSNEGKRIIRGGKRPDLEEVTQWINCGNLHRELIAA